MRLLEKYRAWRERRSTRWAAFDNAVARLRETPCETAYRLIEFETCPMMRAALLDLARDAEREEALGRMQGWEWSHDELRAMLDAAQPDIERESVLGDVPPISASSDPRCRVVLLEPLG